MPNKARTIKDEVRRLGQRKNPMTYERMAETIREAHPAANTSVKTVQWYASQLRREGSNVRVKLGGNRERRDWRNRPADKPAANDD